jgi:ubiquitin carboxyl-terminal hydrolase 36/42
MDNIFGINNIGNTCYMNSAIQLFLNYRVIKKFIYVNDFTNIKLNILKNFINNHDPKNIKLLLGEKNKQFIGGQQNDSHECLITLLDILEEAIKNEDNIRAKIKGFDKKIAIGNTNIPITKLLDTLLNINIISNVKCPKCNYISETKKEEKIISLPITNTTNTLYDCLTEFQNIERLSENDKWKCDKCKEYVCADKWLNITQIPKYITIHLKRFTNNNIKNGKSIEMPENIEINNQKYELRSYILHHGSSNGGHYINYSKINNKYILFNDAVINESNFSDKNQGYIFLYNRI